MTKKPPYPSCPGRWQWHALAVIAMIGGTVLLYSRALNLGFFNLDDSGYVVNNPWIRGATLRNLRHILGHPYFGNYSPVNIFSFLVDYAVAGLNPRFFHISSTLWAGVGAALVYLLGVGVTGKRAAGWIAGLLFMAHPAHVEAVVWIASRKDLVAAVFALAAVLAWLQYRRPSHHRAGWYIASVVCFALAAAGKLSVVVLPVILAGFDSFVEGRRGRHLILDKLPLVAVAFAFALPTFGAQPATRESLSLLQLGQAVTSCLWLLTGFGTYVIYRTPIGSMVGTGIAGLLGLGAVIVLPIVFRMRIRRRYTWGLAIVLLYWIALALIPSQVLSFIHPVTDRYLYFPSVGFVILLGVALHRLASRRRTWGMLAAIAISAVLASAWSYKTWAYVEEWNDPRSVWYAAAKKSQDTSVHLYLGTHYQDMADSLTEPTGGPRPRETERNRLANLVWQGDARLAPLFGEWGRKDYRGPMSLAFQSHLRSLARQEFERALATKGSLVQPNLFFRMGKLELDSGNTEQAREDFQKAYEESRLHTSSEVRQEMAVLSQYALGVIAWRRGEYDEAMRLLVAAGEEQKRAGRIWQPNIDESIERLKRLAEDSQSP
ncbi:MAG: hypothetical protein V1694_00205 [Candidatus Eisenbacteria bacterium]